MHVEVSAKSGEGYIEGIVIATVTGDCRAVSISFELQLAPSLVRTKKLKIAPELYCSHGHEL